MKQSVSQGIFYGENTILDDYNKYLLYIGNDDAK